MIEDYAILGNCETCALVGVDGSIDWLCLPRFDSGACFAALLGTPDNGRWLIAPADPILATERRYLGPTLTLETVFQTAGGRVAVVDCMSRRHGISDLIRRVRGLDGHVAMAMELVVRFDYGAAMPWVSRLEDGRTNFIAGPDRLVLQTDVATTGRDMRTRAGFTIAAGETRDFVLSGSASWDEVPPPIDIGETLAEVTAGWESWARGFAMDGAWAPAVLRSAITLKALTHHRTGGIVAAATTSLPEALGGQRNWDYRYCWLRDAALTLNALIETGFTEEAGAWCDWLLRAVAGSPDQLQIMYGVAGERRLAEYELPWLAGYEGSKPVRVGNAASGQLQLDVYGEVLHALFLARQAKLRAPDALWGLEVELVEHLATIWRQPDNGIWEIRGPLRHFTHSKVMAWVAVDRAIQSAELFALEAPLDRWRALRQTMHDEICAQAVDPARGCFVQYYGATALDASLLLIPLMGFLPPEDPRVAATVRAVEDELLAQGFVQRYATATGVDGLPGGEGVFLACSFWLADNYALLGRLDEARALFARLLGLCNPLGLLAEEYDPVSRRQVGNFPQAFSHVGLINTARNLARAAGTATATP